MEVLIRHVVGIFKTFIKTVFVAGLSEINKRANRRGGSKKACWENFLKKNKKNSMLIREFRVPTYVE